jgi:hypothetical protein
MNFENKGNQRVILINPTLGYGTGLKEARFSFSGLDVDKPSAISRGVKSFELTGVKQTSFGAMADLFDDAKPPQNFTIVLDPGESYPFREAFDIEIPSNAKQRQQACAYFKECGVEFKELQLTYEFSFLPYISDPDFLETLNVRWRRYGQLPVGTNGTYTITSEKITR